MSRRFARDDEPAAAALANQRVTNACSLLHEERYSTNRAMSRCTVRHAGAALSICGEVPFNPPCDLSERVDLSEENGPSERVGWLAMSEASARVRDEDASDGLP